MAEKLEATLEKVQQPAPSEQVTMQQLPESEMEVPAVPAAQASAATATQEPAAIPDASAKRPREETTADKVPLTPGLNMFPEATAARALDDAAAASAAAAAGEPDAKRPRADPIVAPALAGQSPKMEPALKVAPITPADTTAAAPPADALVPPAAPIAAAPADATTPVTTTVPAPAAVPMDAAAVPPSGTTCLLPSSIHNSPFPLACQMSHKDVKDTAWRRPGPHDSLLLLIESSVASDGSCIWCWHVR